MKPLLATAIASAVFLTACGPSDPAAPAGAPVAKAEPAAAPTGEGRVEARPAGLGIAFEHATGFALGPCEASAPRCMVLANPADEAYLRDLLTVQVFDGPLEAVAASEAGFERDAEGRLMTTYGRFAAVEVERFEVNGNPGLRASITCGVSDPETGFHAAAGECLWAVVSDGKRSVVISSSGFENGMEAARAAIASLRFLPSR